MSSLSERFALLTQEFRERKKKPKNIKERLGPKISTLGVAKQPVKKGKRPAATLLGKRLKKK